MAAHKGHKKIGGRKKGTKNKATLLLEDRREEAYSLVDEVLYFVKGEMASDDRDRKLRAIDKLSPILSFILPKLSTIDANINSEKSISKIIFEDAVKKKI